MSISERYRQILALIDEESDRLYEVLPETTFKALRQVDIAAEQMQDLAETVGEISQYQLESKLSPVLLKSHECLDQARVILEQNGHEKEAAKIWELEQLLYRLLNDL